MRKHFLMLLMLAACTEQAAPEPVRVLKSDGQSVVVRGLLDATRTAPPPQYDALAAAECANSGTTAAFVGMKQASLYAFDVTYRCDGAA